MSENQLSALIAKIKDDVALREKLQHATDFDAAVDLAQEAGFDFSKADFLRYHAKQVIELSDEELEGSEGTRMSVWTCSMEFGLLQAIGTCC